MSDSSARADFVSIIFGVVDILIAGAEGRNRFEARNLSSEVVVFEEVRLAFIVAWGVVPCSTSCSFGGEELY